MSRENFEYEAGKALNLPTNIIELARKGDGYDHAFDSMNIMQPLNGWWHWWKAGAASMQSERDQLAAQLAGVVAENAALKLKSREVLKESAYVYSHYNSMGEHLDGESVDGQTLHELQELIEEKTPATDRFLAEQRAQVWTEGSEPKEFGRYWVRYETDVGPQYCSAQWMEYNFCASRDTNIHKIWLADHSRSINSLKGVTHYTKLPEVMESAQLRNEVKA